MKVKLGIVDRDIPGKEVDTLIPQDLLTLNFLKASRVNLKLSTCTYFFGQFIWTCTPLSPPGTKVLVHMKPGNRSTGQHTEKKDGQLDTHQNITGVSNFLKTRT